MGDSGGGGSASPHLDPASFVSPSVPHTVPCAQQDRSKAPLGTLGVLPACGLCVNFSPIKLSLESGLPVWEIHSSKAALDL